jgi:hypothetical protein
MIELYTWTTPNGDKLHIMLEETGLHTASIRSTSRLAINSSPNS